MRITSFRRSPLLLLAAVVAAFATFAGSKTGLLDGAIDKVAGMVGDAQEAASPDPDIGPNSKLPTSGANDGAANDGTGPLFTPVDSEQRRAEAVAAIEKLRVAGRGPKTGYDRDAFGPAWTDSHRAGLSGNGCDTRNDILARDLTDIDLDVNGCVVLAGTIQEPYSGATIAFNRERASEVQIDHIVPLSLAWQMGAAHWDDETRRDFANDPLNLVAVDGPLNGSKGDSSIASWLPPNKQVRCSYAERMALVSLRYDLPTTQADKDMMLQVCDA